MGFKDLKKKIEEASQKYYTDGTSPYSDEEFDSMLEEIRQQDPNSKLMNTGHGYSVELDTTPGEKIKHKYGEAGSLAKVHNWKELSNSLKSCECIIPSLKLDGISIVLYYEEGHLVRAVTRGDGFTGIDVTEKVKIILGDNCDILDKHFTGAVRGELVMSYDNFECYHNIHEEAENPRNSTAGLINKKELSEELRFIDLVVYRIVGIEPDTYHQGNLQKKYTYTLDWLRHNFNNTVYAGLLSEKLSEDNLLSCMDSLRSQWYYKYPADGIVLTDVNLSYDENSYEVSYNSQAFKFPAESKETVVSHVEWNMTKTNYLMPKLIVNTVRLSGTNVSAATGYNAKYILDNNIGPGSVVKISKRGEIIPNVDAVVSCTGAQLPKYCPKCGYLLEFEGVHLCCKNSKCANASIQDLLIWSETLAPKDGLGSTLRLKFYEQYFKEVSIDYVMSNLLDVSSNIQDAGIQVKTFIDSLLDMHENPIKAEDAIKALNIPRLGDKNCKKLAQFPDLVKTLMNYSTVNIHDASIWATVPTNVVSEIGKANFESIVKNIDKFKRLSYIFDQIVWPGNNVLIKGKVAITGKLSCKRSEFVEMLNNHGWEVSDISKDTKFLITDDPNSSSSKNAKAAKLGITKVTEVEFIEKYMK